MTTAPTTPTYVYSDPPTPLRASLRPLPRSNSPHPDESLAGYLLNLAHRLDLTPAELLRRTGLKTGPMSLLDAQYAVALPPGPAANLAATARLTPDEVRNLTLERFLGTLYDPPENTRLARTLHSSLWVNLGRTRYCPGCLTTTPEGHVVWRIHWITPWAIACTTHGTLLLDTCPACRTQVGTTRANAKSALPNLHLPVTHPAACRAPVGTGEHCGYRLDHAVAPQAPDELLSAQTTFDTIAAGPHPDSPHANHDPDPDPFRTLGQPVTGPQHLRDLRLVVLLLQMARNPNAIDSDNPYAAPARTHITHQPTPETDRTEANRTLTQPPTDTPTAAGLTLTATRLLAHPDNDHRLGELARHAAINQLQPWKKAHATARASGALTNAVLDTRNAITDPQRIRPYATTQTFTLHPDNIPAYLDQDLYAHHLADTDPGHERPLRRWIPIAITRLITNMTTEEAATHLGYTAVVAEAAAARASNAFDPLGHNQLRRRAATIADHLETTTRINYRRLRDHFDDTWLIPEDDWQQLQAALLEERLARADTPWAKRRPAYATWLWTLITHGDPHTAPMIGTTRHGRRSTAGTANTLSELQRRAPPAHHRIVNDLAQVIADRKSVV